MIRRQRPPRLVEWGPRDAAQRRLRRRRDRERGRGAHAGDSRTVAAIGRSVSARPLAVPSPATQRALEPRHGEDDGGSRGDHRALAGPESEALVELGSATATARRSRTRSRSRGPRRAGGERRLRLRRRPVDDARSSSSRARRRGRRDRGRAVAVGPPAVLRPFEAAPVAMPTLVAVDARLRTVGEEITVTYTRSGSAGVIAIVPRRRSAERARDLDGRRRARHGEARTPGWLPESLRRRSCATATATRTPAARSTCAGSRIRRASSRPSGGPERGEPIKVAWTQTPANR